MYKTILSQIKDLGLDDEKAIELFDYIAKEVINLMLQELAANSTDEELKILQQRILNTKSPEQYYSILKEISQTVFGEDSEEKLSTILTDYVKELKIIIDNSKDLLTKYKQKDPKAIALVEKANKIISEKKLIKD